MSIEKEILEEAATLLDKPGRWTQRVGARNRQGDAVVETAKDASCFCLIGAVYRVAHDKKADYNPAWKFLISFLDKTQGYVDPIFWNDRPSRQQSEVVDLLRDAARNVQ